MKKKDGSLKLCNNYQKLNNVAIKNKYFIPSIDGLFYQLHDARFLYKIDSILNIINLELEIVTFKRPLSELVMVVVNLLLCLVD